MDIVYAIILGLVQGFTEFLPVSSSGHLLLLNRFGVANPNLFLNLLLHLATLLASVIFFRKPLLAIIRNPLSKEMRLYVLATIPTAIIALLFKKYCESLLMGEYLAHGFLTTSFLLTLSTLLARKDNFLSFNDKSAFICGIMQGFAVLPGISRSGSTIAIATICGVNKEEATQFSFILGIPIILVGFVFELISEPQVQSVLSVPALIIGFFVALISGFFSIKLMIKLFSKIGFAPFALYTFLLGILV